MNNTNPQFRTSADSATSKPSSADQLRDRVLIPAPLRDLSLGLLFLLSTTAGLDPSNLSPTSTNPPAALEQRRSQEGRRRLRAQIEDSLARLRQFGAYPDDWDSNGALAPTKDAINAALLYLTLLQPWHPTPLATLSREGDTVLEFDDGNAFSSIRFRRQDDDNPNAALLIELYKRLADGSSSYDEGLVTDPKVNDFLRDTLKLPMLRNAAV
jgi:hypothetical protein